MADKILIFTTRHLCYNSGDFFAMQLANGFEAWGIECECCNLEFQEEDCVLTGNAQAGNAEATGGAGMAATGAIESSNGVLTEESMAQLESFLGKSYLALIDFNSRMPHMIMDDGSYYLDGIDAPFYDYILDHPLYHHSTLSCRLKNFHVVVLDRNQRDYVCEAYPWIRNVIWQPLGGQAAVVPCSLDNKREEVLFTGTYRNPENVMMQIMQTKDETLRRLMLDMIEQMQENAWCTIEQALENVLENQDIFGAAKERASFASLLNACYPVEIYIRNCDRQNLIDAFAKKKVPLHIVGDWWEQYGNIDSPAITLQSAVSFARSADIIAKYAVLLDSSPFFQYGIHDRVTAAMANQTVALTDENVYINLLGGGIQTYPVRYTQAAVVRAEELLAHPALRREQAEQAYSLYEKEFSWKRVAEKLLNNFM